MQPASYECGEARSCDCFRISSLLSWTPGLTLGGCGDPRQFERGDTNALGGRCCGRRFGFPVRAGKHRPETGCHAPWAKTWGSRPGEGWTSRRPGPHLDQNVLVPWIFDYYTKLDFSPAHKIHKIHALRIVSASSALSSCFCYRGLARCAAVAPVSILGLSGGLLFPPPAYVAQTWHSKIEIRDEYRK